MRLLRCAFQARVGTDASHSRSQNKTFYKGEEVGGACGVGKVMSSGPITCVHTNSSASEGGELSERVFVTRYIKQISCGFCSYQVTAGVNLVMEMVCYCTMKSGTVRRVSAFGPYSLSRFILALKRPGKSLEEMRAREI